MNDGMITWFGQVEQLDALQTTPRAISISRADRRCRRTFPRTLRRSEAHAATNVRSTRVASRASAVVLGALVALFGAASANPWLPDTPDAVTLSATCETSPSRLARDDCMHRAALQWQAADRRGERVASSR